MTEIVPTQHARLSPSGADKWMQCPGSLVMEAGIPDTSSDFADEGTAAHELAGWCLTSGNPTRAYLGRIIEVPNRQGTKVTKWEVTEEMADYVQEGYVDNIMEKAKHGELYVETRVDFSRFVGIPESFGTSDAIVVMEKQKELNVDDLKYGRGVRVYASFTEMVDGMPVVKGNRQLMTYALAAYDELSLVHDIETIRITIHQPRLNHVSEFVCTVEELLAFGEELRAAAERVGEATNLEKGLSLEAYLNPGEKQCQWCKAKATCPALRNFIANEVFGDFDIVEDEAPAAVKEVPVDDDAIAKCFSLLDLINGWGKAIAAEMHARMSAGRQMPGYKLVEGKKGSRSWIDEADAESAMKSFRLKIEEMYSMKVISPTQAEKLLKGKNPKRWNKLLKMVTQSDGQPHIALATDKRAALVVQPITDDFADETGDDLV